MKLYFLKKLIKCEFSRTGTILDRYRSKLNSTAVSTDPHDKMLSKSTDKYF
jgi:hypothetical protein